MGVVVEALDEPLAHVLVDERVVRDVVLPRLELLGGGQLAVDEEVGDLEVGRLLGEGLDRSAIATRRLPGRFEATTGMVNFRVVAGALVARACSAARRSNALMLRPSLAARAFKRRYIASGMSMVVRMTTMLPYLW